MNSRISCCPVEEWRVRLWTSRPVTRTFPSRVMKSAFLFCIRALAIAAEWPWLWTGKFDLFCTAHVRVNVEMWTRWSNQAGPMWDVFELEMNSAERRNSTVFTGRIDLMGPSSMIKVSLPHSKKRALQATRFHSSIEDSLLRQGDPKLAERAVQPL